MFENIVINMFIICYGKSVCKYYNNQLNMGPFDYKCDEITLVMMIYIRVI